MESDLRFGINVLQNLPFSELSERWITVETLGFDSLWIADHFATRFHPDGIWFDGWSMLAAMAAKTSRIQIGTAVSSTILHNPALLAKRAMTVDHISGGRLNLGIGAGGSHSVWEQKMIGDAPWSASERIERFEEFVIIVDQMLQNSKTSYQGKFYQVDQAIVIPSPIQTPRPPLTIAAHGKKSLQIAARFADTWNTYGKAGVSESENWGEAKKQTEQLEEYCAEIGRDPKEIRKSFYAFIGGHSYAASKDAFYDFIGKYQELGFSEFIFTWLPEVAYSAVGDAAITKRETLGWIALEAIPKLKAKKS